MPLELDFHQSFVIIQCDAKGSRDLVGPGHGQGTLVTMLGFCRCRGARSVVASLHTTVRGGESLAAILQVALVLHLPPHGGVPVVLNGVVCPKVDKIRVFQ